MSRREKTWWWIAGVVILLYCLFPIAWIVSLSLKAPSDLSNGQFLPTNLSWQNYELILTGGASDLFLPALRNSFGIVLILFFINRARIARLPERVAPDETGEARRVLVLANQTLEADELVGELQRIDAMGKATYYVCVPASAVETGTASTHGAVSVAEATTEAAQASAWRRTLVSASWTMR